AQRDVAVGAAEHRGDRVAGAVDRDHAADRTDRVVGQLRVGEQLSQVEAARGDVGAGADGLLARVHADGGADIAAGDTEVQRVQPQHAVVEEQVRIHVVE